MYGAAEWEELMTEGCKILIVEDQMLIAMDLERLIEGMEYQVCGLARTRAEAIRLAEEHRPDLVVMDVRLADGGDGIAVAREMRQRFNIGALMISGQIDAAQAEQAQAEIFLRKPFEARQLRRAIADALRLRQSHPDPE
ncbi:chemotaxis protein CheY [Skermanella stibiiresistens SB22]|uniref:Chemotaxis protein CheY n=2 Tax=Skermanella TaxID=204447 RepID=W9H5U1_9PROT|nr:chemotaxis protein CheY [Skermanella stibiiresistens SB22]